MWGGKDEYESRREIEAGGREKKGNVEGAVINIEKVKQEAIKWAKTIKYADRFEVHLFRKFFNITKEDLNEN